MNKTDKHNGSDSLSEYLKASVQQNIWLVLIIMLLALIFPPISLGLMKMAAKVPGSCLYVPDNVNSWFGYSASYLGAVASVFIGILTIKLTLTLERINEDGQKKQQEYSIATNMPDLICTTGILYDCNQDIPTRHLDKLPFLEGYILELVLKPAFPIYFDIRIRGICFQWKSQYVENHVSKVKDEECRIELREENYDFTNNREFDLSVYFIVDEKKQAAFQNFYELYLRSAHKNYKDNLIEVMIQMECQNVLLSGKNGIGDIPFELCLTMRNMGKNGDKKGISLETINRKIRR